MNRRSFLRATVTVASSLGLCRGAFSAEGAADRKFKLGFLGTAHSHFKEKLKVIQESTDWQLIGLCEEDEAVRNKGPKETRWLSVEELFSNAEVIVIESAVKEHARDAKRALLAGKHVHVEKPPADTLDALRELFQIAKEKKRLLQIGYMWRFNPGINTVLEAARKGWLGDVYQVRATMNTLGGAEQRQEWARFRGGAVFEQGCHLIDPLVRLLGRPTKVTPFLKHHGAFDDGMKDNTVAVFEFPRAIGIISSSPLQPNAGPHRFFEVLGSNGTARVQPLEPPALTIDLAKAGGPYAAGQQEVKLPSYRRYVDEFAALASAIRESKPLAVSAEEELLLQEALLRACEMM